MPHGTAMLHHIVASVPQHAVLPHYSPFCRLVQGNDRITHNYMPSAFLLYVGSGLLFVTLLALLMRVHVHIWPRFHHHTSDTVGQQH